MQVLDMDEKSPTFKQPLSQWKAPDTHFLSFSVAGEHLYFMKNRYEAGPSLGVADAATGAIREIKSVPGIVPVTILAVPGGGLLVGYSDKVARFWNTETARVEWEVPLPSGEDHGHFRPSSRRQNGCLRRRRFVPGAFFRSENQARNWVSALIPFAAWPEMPGRKRQEGVRHERARPLRGRTGDTRSGDASGIPG
jgi:hypothetical protein